MGESVREASASSYLQEGTDAIERGETAGNSN